MHHIFVFEVTYRDDSTEYFNARESDIRLAWVNVALAVGRDAVTVAFSHIQEPATPAE